ncbi:conserved protein of unknown function [Acidithiobacillus ferrivorans]|uniref:Uncharacterized protein n=1 Tax=Acidithiobacillus ferrivorans TaxID=160808 RepID=A0A060UQ94_9PROT|nr:hypothetical protein [Acidithiobacillus ferrivorans]CDQ10595.1 hypothetical protein AFERRI_400376 [Acidithiobacillus ferrivorans]SMH64626.1 conserved protein of unknown function [Acidithiobacillus ferrivorans]
MSADSNLKAGTKVRWLSKSSGYEVENRGEIICIVPAGRQPFVLKENDQKNYTLPDGQKIPYARTRYGGGMPRCAVSYIVRVPNPKTPHAAETYYWPRVSALQIDDGASGPVNLVAMTKN